MIKYSLKCADGHTFDSWFASAGAYDALAESGRLSCAVCGMAKVVKAPMAPRVVPGRKKAPARPGGPADETAAYTLSEPQSDLEAALAEFRARVEANTEDVGHNVVDEARAIHEGRAPDRAIRGEARIAEARALLEEGVPVMPLPFRAARRLN